MTNDILNDEDWERRKKEHLENWLYREARDVTENIRIEQIIKGAEKYEVPLGDADWTAKGLINHALQENIDQNHYLTMLVFKVHQMELLLKEKDHEMKFYKDFYEMEMKKPLD